jgi:hypothetical protein
VTEKEWRECSDPLKMLGFLDGRVSNRKLWLFACGSCRRHANLLADSRCRAVIETGERYADGQANHHELMETSEEAFCRRDDLSDDECLQAAANAAAFSVVDPAERDSAVPFFSTASAVQRTSVDLIQLAELSVADEQDPSETTISVQLADDLERSAQCRLLRCIIGNPFRPIAVSPAWLTPTVRELAQSRYDDRAFERLPDLANALEESGCSDIEILSHCRQPGEHVMGCWVVDLLLGKE